ncbi:hypothetical protein BFJ72_g13451 [Fusarium proliferatum]|uniref:Amine oxidase domain-containing protein n=1 Tax=Gibberella intermedia TaxID=948311 RepID=A0A420SCC4_GIBIN|nr:hypothetical protein BFJ72_g13451 [Fusarium proliferatum]
MPSYNVGIVGAGIAGLYTALLLQREGHSVHIFEATNRIGGRVYTHYFTEAENQYYEAGAMRIPDIESHGVVFSLIEYLNGHKDVPARMEIRLMDYVYRHENNGMYFNSSTVQAEIMSLTPLTAGWESLCSGQVSLQDTLLKPADPKGISFLLVNTSPTITLG